MLHSNPSRRSESNDNVSTNSEYYHDVTQNMNNDESSHFEELVQSYLHDVHYVSITQTALNLTYSMVNIGLVGLPFCAFEIGIPLYVVCVIIFTTLSGYISSLLVEMAEDERVRSFEALAEKAFGAKGYTLTCLVQLIFSFTIICVTLGEWGSVISRVIETNFGHNIPDGLMYDVLTDRKFIVIIGSVMTLPGCFAKTFSSLSWSSYFTISTIIVTIIWSFYTLIRYLDNPEESNNENLLKVREFWWTTDVIICFCLSFQQKLFFVFNCLRRRSIERFAPAVKYSHIFIALVYITFGSVCAINITHVDDFWDFNYFKDYNQSHESKVMFDITRTIVSFSLLFTIPVESLVIVTVWRRLLRYYKRYKKMSRLANSPHPDLTPRGSYSEVEHSARDDDNDSDDAGHTRAHPRSSHAGLNTARVSDRVCCFEMSSLFISEEKEGVGSSVSQRHHEEDNDAYYPSKPPSTSRTSDSRFTSSTLSTITNSEGRDSCLICDEDDLHHFASFKSNTTDDNLKAIMQTDTEPPLVNCTPAKKRNSSKRNVSFQDENLLRLSAASEQQHNVSIHLIAESPQLLADGSVSSRSGSGSAKSLTAQDRETHFVQSSNEVSYLSDDMLVENITSDELEEYITERRSSVGHMEELKSKVSLGERLFSSLPVLSVWASTTIFSVFIYQTFLFTALFIAAMLTSIFVFLMPSMIYFRLGVKSDYESIPICGFVPNRLYMFVIQFLGLLFIFGTFSGLFMTVYFSYKDHHNSMF